MVKFAQGGEKSIEVSGMKMNKGMTSLLNQDRPPSYPGSTTMDDGEVRRDSSAVANVFFNEAIMSFTGKLAASYLTRQVSISPTVTKKPFSQSKLLFIIVK